MLTSFPIHTHSCQTFGFSRVYPDVTGLELSLEPASVGDPFGSPQFSMESVLYNVQYCSALERLTPLLKKKDVHVFVPAHSLELQSVNPET